MALALQFTKIVDSLPDDWTDMELELRIDDLDRYQEAAVFLSQCNALPYESYSDGDWMWKLHVAKDFGHAASAETVHGTLVLLDSNQIEGELQFDQFREGRSEITHGWGRPESVREEFARRRNI